MRFITEDMLPCVITCNGEYELYWINNLKDKGCYFGNSWICEWTDNPKLVITQAELQQYFPERFI